MNLTPEDFQSFYKDIHGFSPFKWQQRLLAEVLQDGWPDAIDLPTGAGKTSVLDIAVFALALQANLPRRTAPMRIALVVDRRIVVDGTFDHAAKITKALESGRTPVLQAAADALKSFGGDKPLAVRRMRGGLFSSRASADSPVQPTVIASTVDQVGSRLLHRGYGLSPNAQPIQAGLLGEDALIILDEAHCSQPFEETLKAVRKYRDMRERPLGLPWGFTSMSATPGNSAARVFRLNDEERAEELLRCRIEVAKPAELVPLQVSEDKLPEAILKLIESGSWIVPGEFLLVITNRVKTARALFQLLQGRSDAARGKKNQKKFTPILLVGRARPLDRDRLIREHIASMRSGRKPEENPESLVVVATQCVEVGADLDADSLITQVCPLDSLKQRFGRLNRLGAKTNCRAAIFAGKKDQEKTDKDPVYGAALGNTWKWLNEHAAESRIGMGIAELARLPQDSAQLCTKKKNAPVLFPGYLDLLAATNPAPSFQTPVELFLHGQDSQPAGIRFAWRKDLCAGESDSWQETVELCPPLASESMPVSYLLAKAWLKQREQNSRENPKDLKDCLARLEAEDSDVEGQFSEAEPILSRASENQAPLGMVWRGKDSWLLTADRLGDIRPGDAIVIPAETGGADRYGWTGNAENIPSDLAEDAALQSGALPYLRITDSLNRQFWGEDAEPPESWLKWSGHQANIEEGFDESEAAESVQVLLPAWLQAAQTEKALGKDVSDSFLSVLNAFVSGQERGISVLPHPSGHGIIIRLLKEKSDQLNRRILLARHLEAAEQRTRKYAEKLNLPPAVSASATEAARLHDLGKADPRFQLALAGSNPMRLSRAKPLAKSAIPPKIPVKVLYERAGLPSGFRHELLSSLMAEEQLEQEGTVLDKRLTLHLIESHHGRCRPFAPSIDDKFPVTAKFKWNDRTYACNTRINLGELSSAVAGRFETCLSRYGWWGTSFLEALVRLADQKASENNEGADE